jgi:hypothetical protein
MAMAKARPAATDPIGPLLAANLFRLGHADIVVRATALSGLIAKKTDRTMTRQRISALMNAVHVEPETVELLAKALGVKPAELTRRVEMRAVPLKP